MQVGREKAIQADAGLFFNQMIKLGDSEENNGSI